LRTNVYIDGFNLYYGLFRNDRRLPWKWLDLAALSSRLLPRTLSLHRIRYFTAEVVPRRHDPDQAIRQQTYLRALETIPSITIHKGNFLTNPKDQVPLQPVPMPAMNPKIRVECRSEVRRALRSLRRVRVLNTEEKGLDVNLASYLLFDVALGDCEAVMIISNDSDLATPLQLARDTWRATVVVVNPHPGRPTALLHQMADEYRQIRPAILPDCQLPPVVYDSVGRAIHKPRKWMLDEQRYLARQGR
jgi:uncharacterized LabA/DUF88 family protein